MPVTVPTKTDGSIGREKREQPLNALIPLDLDYYETAAEREAQKDALIELAGAVNDLESGAGAGPQLLLDMPIATSAVAAGAAASWGRCTNNLPATPAGTASVSLVADPTGAGGSCLRVGATGSAEGLWMYALQNLTVPAAGFVLEIDVADLPDVSVSAGSGVIGLGYEDYALGGARSAPRGLFLRFYRGAANFDLRQWRLETTNYTRDEHIDLLSGGTLHDTAAFEAGGFRLRIEVRRVNATTPYRYLARVEIFDEAGGQVWTNRRSSFAFPLNADLNAKTFTKIGIGGHVDTSGGPAGDGWISVRQLRVWSL